MLERQPVKSERLGKSKIGEEGGKEEQEKKESKTINF